MSTIRSMYENEKGMALPLGLIFLAILTLMGTIAVMTSTTDTKIGGNYKTGEQAFYVAEAGIERARDYLRKNSGSGFNDELEGADNAPDTADDGVLQFEYTDNGITQYVSSVNVGFGAGTYTVRVIDNYDESVTNDQFNDIDNKIVIVSTGEVQVNGITKSMKTIEVLFGIAFDNPDGALGVYTPDNQYGGPYINITGNPTFDGGDYDLPGDFECTDCTVTPPTNSDDGVPGLYTEQDSPTVDESYFTGNPQTKYGDGSDPNWVAVANQLVPQVDADCDFTYTETETINASKTFGSRTNPQLVVVTTSENATATFSGDVHGAGVLIIRGDGQVNMTGNLHWEGIVILLSDKYGYSNLSLTGDVYLFGAFVTASTADAEYPGGVSLTFSDANTAQIVYSSTAIEYAKDLCKIVYSWKDTGVVG